MNGEIQVRESSSGNTALSLKQIGDRVNLVHQVLEKVMKKGTHYGTVPGCGARMVLFKPGADVLAMTFQLVPQFSVTRTDLENGHREYDVTCSMYSAGGAMLGQGVGSGSTMEKKYRYRTVDGKKIENEDIADVYNTVLKMAKKRAHVDATLTVTGAGDLFTQDLIDEDGESGETREPIKAPQAKTAPATDGQLSIEAVIDSVSVKDGKGARGPWKKYGVKVGEVWYSTFDAKAGAVAESLKGKAARIVYTTDANGYHNIVSIEAAKAEQAAPGAILAEAVSLVEKGKPTKVTAAMKAASITEYEEGGDWQSVSIEKLTALVSLLKA